MGNLHSTPRIIPYEQWSLTSRKNQFCSCFEASSTTIVRTYGWQDRQTTLPRRRQMWFPQHIWMSRKLKSSPVRTHDVGKNVCPPFWTSTESETLLHLRLLNQTQARLRNKLMIEFMQIRYVSVLSNDLFDVYDLLLPSKKDRHRIDH